MPQLLLEILSEEIPARMQAKAEADLVKALMDGLTAAGLIPEGIKGFSGPRRLVAVVEGLPVKSADVTEDIQGPKEGAPQPAIDGFLRKAGLKSISEAHLHDVPKKGKIYVAHVRKPGRETAALVAQLIPSIIRGFHWPKSMRWASGDLRWVRPISRILCTFDGEVVPFEIDGIKSDAFTEGHRVMGRGPFKVRRFEDYEDVIKNKGRVILDREERKEIILTEAKQLCAAQNLELVEDIGLLEEVAGLAEWPVVIIGDMDKSFLDLPLEVIRLSMRTHQKYFAVRDPKANGLAPKFIVVANLDAADGGEQIAAGNSRVLSARLNDARFFWDNDRRVPLESRFDKLDHIVFHQKLGSVRDKSQRTMKLARDIADRIGANPADAEYAAKLAKCDLASDMVGEFAELEGIMGRYYAIQQKFSASVADAIRDHYKPKGPSDEVPSAPVSISVALADKIDTLVGFWAIGEKPTGSSDPYALRRAALGVIRQVLGRQVRIRLKDVINVARMFGAEREMECMQYIADLPQDRPAEAHEILSRFGVPHFRTLNGKTHVTVGISVFPASFPYLASNPSLFADVNSRSRVFVDLGGLEDTLPSLLSFFADRLKVHLREQGARHDLIDAVFALGEDDLVLIVKRVEALGQFLDTEDGKNLLAGYKRAANILAIEEKKDGRPIDGEVDPKLMKLPQEAALLRALEAMIDEANPALNKEDSVGAMKALSKLRGPVDAFFDKVTVNAEDKELRLNRLRLLRHVRHGMHLVADFSKIEG